MCMHYLLLYIGNIGEGLFVGLDLYLSLCSAWKKTLDRWGLLLGFPTHRSSLIVQENTVMFVFRRQ